MSDDKAALNKPESVADVGRVKLAVVVLNYRTPDMVLDALASLEGQLSLPESLAVVVDNDSGDGSAARIESGIAEHGFGAWARLIESGHNGGFAAGNNVGIRAVDADYYLLLNSDTIVRPGAIATLLSAAEAEPDVGLASPRLEWPDGTPQISCFRDPSPVSELIQAAATGPITRVLERFDVPVPIRDEPFDVEWTSFACVLIRRDVIDRVGLLDEGYFMYYEDADYCRAARVAGYRIRHFPQAHVVHLRGGSSEVKRNSAARKRRPRYFYAARTRYFRKRHGFGGAIAANVLWTMGRGVCKTREVIGERKERVACDQEWLDNWTDVLQPLRE